MEHKQPFVTDNFLNLDTLDQGLEMQLADGIQTRIFCGGNAMISMVRIDPVGTGERHSHPQE